MTDLLIPVAHKLVINQASIPFAMLGKLSGVIRNERDARDIGAAFGRGYRPQKPIMLIGPDEKTVILIVGGEAAEIEDIAIAKFDQQRRLAEKGQRGFRFAEAREAHGMPPIEKVDGLIREAIRERVRKHKRNPVTDPGKNSRKDK